MVKEIFIHVPACGNELQTTGCISEIQPPQRSQTIFLNLGKLNPQVVKEGDGEGSWSCNHKEKLKNHCLWILWNSLSFQIVVKAFMALMAMAAMPLKSIECSSSICTYCRADLL
jgi:hypothetical protein